MARDESETRRPSSRRRAGLDGFPEPFPPSKKSEGDDDAMMYDEVCLRLVATATCCFDHWHCCTRKVIVEPEHHPTQLHHSLYTEIYIHLPNASRTRNSQKNSIQDAPSYGHPTVAKHSVVGCNAHFSIAVRGGVFPAKISFIFPKAIIVDGILQNTTILIVVSFCDAMLRHGCWSGRRRR